MRINHKTHSNGISVYLSDMRAPSNRCRVFYAMLCYAHKDYDDTIAKQFRERGRAQVAIKMLALNKKFIQFMFKCGFVEDNDKYIIIRDGLKTKKTY